MNCSVNFDANFQILGLNVWNFFRISFSSILCSLQHRLCYFQHEGSFLELRTDLGLFIRARYGHRVLEWKRSRVGEPWFRRWELVFRWRRISVIRKFERCSRRDCWVRNYFFLECSWWVISCPCSTKIFCKLCAIFQLPSCAFNPRGGKAIHEERVSCCRLCFWWLVF